MSLKGKHMPELLDEENTPATEGTAEPTEPPKKGRKKRDKATKDTAPKAGGRPTRITDAVVLKIGEGESLVKRPKYKTIVAAFGAEGKTVGEALKAAAEELSGKLKSARFEKDQIGYLRGYLGELLAAKALVAVSDGTEAPAQGTESPADDSGQAGETAEA